MKNINNSIINNENKDFKINDKEKEIIFLVSNSYLIKDDEQKKEVEINKRER